jgi:DNA-binding MarR family transcriptional regulator
VPKAPEPPNFLFPLFVTGQLAGALLGRAIEETGLTPNEFAVLSMVGALGPITPSDLAARAGMPPTTMSDYVSRLRSRGLIEPSPHPVDRRSYRLELTAAGRERNSRALAGLFASNRAIAERLGAEATSVRDSLLELEQALRRANTTDP